MVGTSTRDRVVTRYLHELESAARGLPPLERRELLAEIRSHIATALPRGDAHSEADVRQVLDNLGSADEIVRAAGGQPLEARAGAREIITVLLVLLGGLLLPLIGWFAGIVMLWSSAAWTTREKLIGTLVLPGGLIPAFALTFLPVGDTGACTPQPASSANLDAGTLCPAGTFVPPWLAIIVMVLIVLAPIVVSIHLLRSARAGAGP